jgi:putative membrane-bound dehydrogenase-like protein
MTESGTMTNRFRLLVAAAVVPACSASAAELKRGDRTFIFPDDYTLEVAAGPPLVERPIEADFDPQGRLYVTESSGSNEPVEEQLKKKPHRVLRLVDTDGDGVFDARTVFAEGLMFPEGCLWHEGSLYVSAPPQIWKLTDADDDGVAEAREVWFDGKTLTGCANDLHGPYRGPDGWIYWCKGAFAEQTYDLPGRPGWKTTASHVFRARAGATGPEAIEPVFTAGMDNPVGLAWTPEGDLIVAGTFFQHPGGGQRDGLIHAVRGGVWGKDHDVLAGHPRTGALMPPMTHLGPAAPAGLTRYGRDLLCAQFNLRKVSRHALTPEGASYKTADSDFLSCDHPDFHPTDVFQAPDGSVLVIDTGGWYKLCCPTSQVAKPNVLGAVYRLRKTGGEVPVEVPAPAWAAGERSSEPELVRDLASDRLHVRRLAAEALGRRQRGSAVPALLEALAAPEVERFLFHAFTHALLEIGDPDRTRPGLVHAHPAVRAASLYALAQMPQGGLAVADVVPHLGAADDRLREAALFVIERHADWADGLAGWMRGQLAMTDAGGDTLRRVMLALGSDDHIRSLLGAELAAATAEPARVQLLGVMAALRPERLPEDWRSEIAAALARGRGPERAAAIAVIRQASPEDRARFSAGLAAVAQEPKETPGVRLEALAALGGGALAEAEFRFALAQVREPAHGAAAAAVLAAHRLDPSQLRALAAVVADAGLLERPVLLKCFAHHNDEPAGLALVAALERSRTLAATPPDTLRETFGSSPEAVQKALAAAQAKNHAPDQAARLSELEKTLPPGDVERGLIVFQSAKAACSTCHPVGYKGGNLGPDLSKVGAIRTRRDLLEAIVFPSASFVRSYEPVQIIRKDDTVAYGIVTNQGGAAFTLATGAATPAVRVPQGEIKSMTPGAFSLMPQGMDQILSPEELADVVAYLQSRR